MFAFSSCPRLKTSKGDGGLRYTVFGEIGYPVTLLASGKHLAITGVTLPGSGAVVSCDLMALNALLMCSEEPVLRVLGTALEEVKMEPEVCMSAPEALDLTVVRHYSALVLDFDLPGAAIVARMARLVLRDIPGWRQFHHLQASGL
jgi:hypothetical protein